MNTLDRVKEFHTAFCPEQVKGEWVAPDKKLACLRLQLLTEELAELAYALAADDKIEVLDALIDLQYVLDGTFWAFGLAYLKESAFSEVHDSNMSKLDENGCPVVDTAGRVCKSNRYRKPDLARLFKYKEEE